MSEMLNNPNQAINSLDELTSHINTPTKEQALQADEWAQSDGIPLDIVPPPLGRTNPATDAIPMSIGSLTIEQLTAIFSTMPVDLTFVDANDRVRFVSEGPNRVFIRPKTIIGRKVQNCHPSESLDTVERILSDFRAGKQSVADFWINFNERFVFIRYFALRDQNQAYMGTLEVTQDLTNERTLVGERRLLQYDQPEN